MLLKDRSPRSAIVHGLALAGILGFALGVFTPPQKSEAAGPTVYIWGRDNWLPAGSSRILRVIGNVNLIASPGDIPTVSFSPGPIIVNYVLVSNPRDLTVSITVPASTPPGVESIQVTDGTLVNSWADFFLVINGGMIGNPSPSVWQRNQSGIITIPPNPLFQGQTHFVMDLGDGVSVGPITLQPDGTLQAPISVVGWASQGTRWIHLLAGPYTFISDRGFAVDFGPLTTTIQIVLGGNPPIQRGVKVPLGYTVSVFALPTARNGLLHPDNMFVDQFDTLYVLNPGPQTIPPNFTISMFDLSPSNYGAFKGLLSNFDASGLGGLLESAAMLPSAPGKIFVSTEDFPTNGFPGGNTITEVDTVTGASSLFFFNPNWTLDPIATDAQGNLVGSANINNLADPGDFYTLSPSGVVLGTCPLANWADAITRDPLSGKFLITGASTVGGAYTLDPSTCSSTPLTDGPELDEGAFGRDRGNFGNGYFVPPTGSLDTAGEVDTLMPAPYTDSVAEHSVPFIKFLDNPDGVAFDRDGLHLLVTDPFSSDVMDFHPDPTVTPEVALSSLSAHSLAFGSQNLNLASAAQTVTLSNTDVAPLTLAGIFITGDYTQTNDCGSSVAGGASCTISVVFTATALGDRPGSLTIVDSGSPSPDVVSLDGTGITRQISLSASSLDFGGVLVGVTSAPMSVTMTNSGTYVTTFTGISASGDFAESNNCGTSLAASASCTVNVTFKPSAGGAVSGMLALNDNAPGSPQQVALSGIGQDFSVSPSPVSQTVVNGFAANFTVTITPLGGWKGNVAVACGGAPTGASCRLTPSSGSLDGTDPLTVNMHVTTTSSSGGGPRVPGAPGAPAGPWLWVVFALGAAISAREIRKRLKVPVVRALVAGAALGLLFLLPACGGSGRNPNGTIPGSYKLTLQATSGPLVHTTSVTLSVR